MISKKHIFVFISQLILLLFTTALFSKPDKDFSKKNAIEDISIIDCEETEDDTKIFDAVAIIPSDSFFFTFDNTISFSESLCFLKATPLSALPRYLRLGAILV